MSARELAEKIEAAGGPDREIAHKPDCPSNGANTYWDRDYHVCRDCHSVKHVPRALSLAEQEGWRRFWDGWKICPPCVAKFLATHRQAEWDVPANYDHPIPDDAHCSGCRITPAALRSRAASETMEDGDA